MDINDLIFLIIMTFLLGVFVGVILARWYVLTQIDYQKKLEKLKQIIKGELNEKNERDFKRIDKET